MDSESIKWYENLNQQEINLMVEVKKYSQQLKELVSWLYQKDVSVLWEKRDNLRQMKTAWRNMHARCYNPNIPNYAYYGARGITVCDAWHDFEAFYSDMLPNSMALTLDRIDNEGNYSKANCRWVTMKVQAQNRRQPRFKNKININDKNCVQAVMDMI